MTHPESPKMMTFKSTFFLEVILPQLGEEKEKMFRQRRTPPRPAPHTHSSDNKYINLCVQLLHTCAGREGPGQSPLRPTCPSHVISKLLTKSRGTHHSHTPQEGTPCACILQIQLKELQEHSIFDSVTEQIFFLQQKSARANMA